ncbi:hypothetical protein ES703_89188 [subsurface metagenome]
MVTKDVSLTVPIISPLTTASPFFFVGLNLHFFFLSRPGIEIPRVILSPAFSLIIFSGLCVPSYIDSISPGPSSTDRGIPVA